MVDSSPPSQPPVPSSEFLDFAYTTAPHDFGLVGVDDTDLGEVPLPIEHDLEPHTKIIHVKEEFYDMDTGLMPTNKDLEDLSDPEPPEKFPRSPPEKGSGFLNPLPMVPPPPAGSMAMMMSLHNHHPPPFPVPTGSIDAPMMYSNGSSKKFPAMGYDVMVANAIASFGENKGASLSAIVDYISMNYDVKPNFKKFTERALGRGIEKDLFQKKNGIYKLLEKGKGKVRHPDEPKKKRGRPKKTERDPVCENEGFIEDKEIEQEIQLPPKPPKPIVAIPVTIPPPPPPEKKKRGRPRKSETETTHPTYDDIITLKQRKRYEKRDSDEYSPHHSENSHEEDKIVEPESLSESLDSWSVEDDSNLSEDSLSESISSASLSSDSSSDESSNYHRKRRKQQPMDPKKPPPPPATPKRVRKNKHKSSIPTLVNTITPQTTPANPVISLPPPQAIPIIPPISSSLLLSIAIPPPPHLSSSLNSTPNFHQNIKTIETMSTNSTSQRVPKKRGRPRIHPPPDPQKPKRPRDKYIFHSAPKIIYPETFRRNCT